jgi:uncharacterized protein
MISKEQTHIILQVLSPFQPDEIGIFGSYARDEQTPESDLDVLVSFRARVNLFDLIGLEQELTHRLGIKVDLVTRGSLSPLLEPLIEKDLKKLAG